jgi:uncharacterized sodium:solute symporter family permease YidK
LNCFVRVKLNKVAKYALGVFAIVIVVYIGWIVIKAVFPLEEYFEQNPTWRSIFILIGIVGVIGVLSWIITPKGKWN